jgi:hypothetical protein
MHLEDIRIDGGMILKYIFKKWVGGMSWIDLQLDREILRALVNTVMNFMFP